MIDPQNSHPPLNQCFLKLNAIWSHVFDCTRAVCLFLLWVLVGYLICFQKPKCDLITCIWLHVKQFACVHFLIGYAICLQKPKAIKSHMFNCMWANFLVFNLSSHWLSDLLPKPIWSHMFDCKWAVCLFSLWVLISYLICCQKPNAIWLHAFDCTWSSLLVFNLSSDWLGNLFPNTNHTCLIVPEELACFYFEFWLSIRSVFKIRTQLGQFGLIGCFWHLSSFWLAVVTTLVFWFSTLNQIPL